MAKYVLQDSVTGREIEVEGETPPTPADIAALFKEAYPDKPLAEVAGEIAGDATAEVGGAVAGQMLGSPLGPPGMAIGGAIGGGVGNTIAQLRRMARGDQADFKIGELAGAVGFSAIPGAPMVKGASTIARAAQVAKTGALVGGGSDLTSQVIDDQQLNVPRLAVATGAGAVIGGVIGVAEAKMLAGRFGKVKAEDIAGKPPEEAAKVAAKLEGIPEEDAMRLLDEQNFKPGPVEFTDAPKPKPEPLPLPASDQPARPNLATASAKEIDAWEQAVREHDRNTDIAVFGEERAKEYRRLQRTANSTNISHERSAAASDKAAAMEEALTPEQRNVLYGQNLPESYVSLDDAKSWRNLAVNIDTAEDVGELASVSSGVIQGMLRASADSRAMSEVESAFAQRAMVKAKALGVKPQELVEAAFAHRSRFEGDDVYELAGVTKEQFDTFVSSFDQPKAIAPSRMRLGGQRGAVSPAAMMPLAGGVAGGVAGSTQGETPEERARNALLGFGLGASLSAGARRIATAKVRDAIADGSAIAFAKVLPEATMGALTTAMREQPALSAMLVRDGAMATQDLVKAMKKATPAQAETATQLLWGNNLVPSSPGAMLPVDLARAVQSSRDAIDELQGKLIALNVATGKRADMVKDSIGRYARRAYEAFENPAFVREESDPKFQDFVIKYANDAEQAALTQKGVGFNLKTQEEYRADGADLARRLLQRGKGGVMENAMELVVSGGSRIGKNGEVWQPRKAVDDSARALLGEITDPAGIVSQTVPRLARLIAAHETQKKMRDIGLKTGMFTTHSSPTHSMALSTEGAHTTGQQKAQGAFDQLADLWTTPEIAAAMHSHANYDDWGVPFRALATLTAASKVGKTVLNPASYAPNLISSLLAPLIQGKFRGFATSNNWKKAGLIIADDIGLRRVPAALEKDMKMFIEQRIVGQSTSARDLQTSVNQALSTNFPVVGTGVRAIKAGINKGGSFYGGSEDLGRVLGFYGEKADYRKAYPAMPEAELNLKVAQNVREVYSNYSEIPKGVKKLSGIGALNAFVNFTYEQVRNGVNTYRLAAREMKEGHDTGNRALMAIGAKRFAAYSTALAAGTGAGLASYSKRKVGVTDEEEAALRRRAPTYDQKGMWYFHGLNDKEFSYSNQSYILPTSIAGGIITDIVSAKDPVDAPKAFISAMWNQFGGDGGLILKPLAEAFTGRNSYGNPIATPESTPAEAAVAKTGYFLERTAVPLIVKEVEKGILAANGQPGPDGQVYTLEERAKRIMGARVNRLNLETRFAQQAHSLGARLSESQRWRSREDRMAQTDPAKLQAAYADSEVRRQKIFSDTAQYIKDAATLKQPEEKTIANLRAAGLGSEFILGAMDGKYVPGPKDKAASNQEIVDWLRTLPEQKRKAEENRLMTENRGLVSFVRNQAREEARNITPKDKLISALEVPGGTRAKWIQGQLDSMAEYDDRKRFVDELEAKRLLTKEVVAQMRGLRAPRATMEEIKARQ